MKRKDKHILKRMLDETKIISDKMNTLNEKDFLDDLFVQRGIVMGMLIIGELAKNLDPELQQKYTDVPWRSIKGLRDVAAHGYALLEMQDIWITATKHIPELEQELQAILEKDKDMEDS